MSIKIPDAMNGIFSVMVNQKGEVVIRTYTGTGYQEYYEHRLSDDYADEFAFQILKTSREAKAYLRHMKKKDIDNDV